MEIEKAGQYFSGLDYNELGTIALMRKMRKIELNNGGRDYRFGIENYQKKRKKLILDL